MEEKAYKSKKLVGLNSISIKVIDLDKINISNNNLYKEQPKKYTINDDFFTLFTSGSTGKPKAIVHSALNYFSYAKYTSEYYFGLSKSSIMFTATDAGWINGHTYALYGPLGLGAKTVICENLQRLSNPIYLLEILKDLRVTCFYSSVTLLRLIKSKVKENDVFLKNLECKNDLQRIGSCGEPLANEVGRWALEFFKPTKKTIVNTYFQTETGGILVAPREEDLPPNDYSCVGKPRSDLEIFLAKNIYSEAEIIRRDLEPNELFVKNSWNGIFKKVVSDRETNYFTKEGFYRLHDVGFYDQKGFLFIGGRSDDVINTSGHRISSAEIESICLSLPNINEASAVSIKDALIGERITLFISLINSENVNKKNLSEKIRNELNNKLSNYHIPKNIFIFPDLPKTKSGKIVRRILKHLANYFFIDFNKDFSTLANLSKFKESEISFFKSFVREFDGYYSTLISFERFNATNSLKRRDANSLLIFIVQLIEIFARSNQLKSLMIKNLLLQI